METNNTTGAGSNPQCDYIKMLDSDSCLVFTKFIINTVIAGVICLLGFAGNTMSFAVLKRDKQTPMASLLLRTLAITDTIFLACWFLHFSVRDLLRFVGVKQYRNLVWEYIKTYSYPLLYIGQSATIWLTVFIAFTRYFAVCRPYSASRVCNSRTVRNGIIFICLFAIIYNLPRFFEYSMVHRTLCQEKLYLPDRTVLSESEIYAFIYRDIFYYIFSFALPLILLAGLNTKLIWAYRKIQQRKRALRANSQNTNSQRDPRDPNITLVMIIVVLIFMICNLPARVVQIIWAYDIPSEQCSFSHKFLITELSTLLEVLNSSTNFIVYCVFRSQFRDILQNRLFNCSRTVPPSGAETNATQSLLNGVTCKTTVENVNNCQVTNL